MNNELAKSMGFAGPDRMVSSRNFCASLDPSKMGSLQALWDALPRQTECQIRRQIECQNECQTHIKEVPEIECWVKYHTEARESAR